MSDHAQRLQQCADTMRRCKAASIDAHELEDAADEIERLRAALEKIACRHVTIEPLWWQTEARNALDNS